MRNAEVKSEAQDEAATTGAPLIQSLVRADRIVSVIAEAGPGGVGLAEIAAAAGLNKSTAHHLIRTLIVLGHVEQSRDSRNYLVGLRPHHIMWKSRRLSELSGAWHDVMLRLSHKSGEIINLTVPHGHGALVLSSLEGRSVNKVSPHTGGLWPLHATASGKIMLAHLSERQRESILPGPHTRFTVHTITDREALAATIDRIARQGFAEEIEEHELGAACVGVPLFDPRGTFCGALSIAGPTSRMDETRRRDLTELIVGEVSGAVRLRSNRITRAGRR